MELFGDFDKNIQIIEEAFDVKIISRDNKIKISGSSEGVVKAETVIKRLINLVTEGDIITKQSVSYLVQLANDNEMKMVNGFCADYVCVTARGRQIKCKTHGQKKYVEAIKNNDVVFGIGPAGTGKTFLAVAMAVTAFKKKEVDKIVLTRPAVEAGEKLGFLPGDLQHKVDPYLRPLYDSLYEMMGFDAYQNYLEKGMIEVVPLAYMRGRTLDNSFIIMDEAQNTTPEQMKMFLTRIGFGSKVVVTGDITQIDLPKDKKSGLKDVINILKNIKGLEFVYLSDKDVVRHELVQRIIQAYEKYEKAKNKRH
ncbi:MAG TPA: phosphate starvation-inducible protein PhoH [Ruminiclostridium sp.]|nr:phosphate starvation-inducible protein PhoH [Acetivibrio saccincola]HAA42679.1 phosphate starvation-inducible protein PhoH [Ruminiclostridium sp.]